MGPRAPPGPQRREWKGRCWLCSDYKIRSDFETEKWRAEEQGEMSSITSFGFELVTRDASGNAQ